MDRYEEDMFDELGFDEAEGAADSYDEMDEADEFDEMDEADEYDGGDEYDVMDEADEYDEMDEAEVDEADEYDEGDEVDEEEWDAVMAHALGAEDTDEFFRRIARGIGRAARGVANVARRVAPVVGQIARVVGPIASAIPLPQTQAIGRVANVVGQLMADESSEEEALDAFAELAVRNRAAVPVVAAMAARRVLGPAAARMPVAARAQAVRTVRQAANQLVNRGGPAAIRALPRIARSVQRTGVARRTPPVVRPRVLAQTARRVAQRNPQLRRQLTRPLGAGRRVVNRAGAAARRGAAPGRAIMQGRLPQVGGAIGGSLGANLGGIGAGFGGIGGGAGYGRRARSITIRGPVRINIRPA
jgi:hypothetical protein